jgi:hypothetical protein
MRPLLERLTLLRTGAEWTFIALLTVALIAAVPLAFYGTHLYLGLNWFFTVIVVVNCAIAWSVLGIGAAVASLSNQLAMMAIFLYRTLLVILLAAAAVYGAYRIVVSA